MMSNFIINYCENTKGFLVENYEDIQLAKDLGRDPEQRITKIKFKIHK